MLAKLMALLVGKPKGKKKGTTLVEYIVLVTLIVLAAIVALTALGSEIANEFDDVRKTIDGATATSAGD